MQNIGFFSPQIMHIPDGFLSVVVSALFWLTSLIILYFAVKNTQKRLNDRLVPLMGVMAAAIFAGQMLNFTVIGGTSGHLLGAALATIILGPWPTVVVMTSVVSIQALIFQDGGVLALGANLFNMAVVGVFVSYAVYRFFITILKKVKYSNSIAGFLAAWASIFIASLSCALQLTLSGTSPANIVIPAMAGIHALIGLGEGMITVGAILFIQSVRKDLLIAETARSGDQKGIIAGGLIISAILAILSPLASSHPDGLEWVAEKSGFMSSAKDAFYSIIPDYSLPGVQNENLATITAGIIGLLLVFLISFGWARLKKPSKKDMISEG